MCASYCYGLRVQLSTSQHTYHLSQVAYSRANRDCSRCEGCAAKERTGRCEYVRVGMTAPAFVLAVEKESWQRVGQVA